MYVASASICTPNSLSQEVALALGAQAGEARYGKPPHDRGYPTADPLKRRLHHAAENLVPLMTAVIRPRTH